MINSKTKGKDFFQQNKNEFSLLKVTIDGITNPMSVKEKPIYLKSRSKGTMDNHSEEYSKILQVPRVRRNSRVTQIACYTT